MWVLSFLAFGYATEEFEVTEERLGVYRPEEHIDNPKDCKFCSQVSFIYMELDVYLPFYSMLFSQTRAIVDNSSRI